MQVEDPGSEWPPTHGVHTSVAPVLKWFSGHASTPVLPLFVFVPATFVEQNAEPAPE